MAGHVFICKNKINPNHVCGNYLFYFSINMKGLPFEVSSGFPKKSLNIFVVKINVA
jgi:hypothetical protein